MVIQFNDKLCYFHGFDQSVPYFREGEAETVKLGDNGQVQRVNSDFSIKFVREVIKYNIIPLLSAASSHATKNGDDGNLSRLQGILYYLGFCSDQIFMESLSIVENSDYSENLLAVEGFRNNGNSGVKTLFGEIRIVKNIPQFMETYKTIVRISDYLEMFNN